MTPANAQPSAANRPRVGIPWRTSDEEAKAKAAGPKWKAGKTEDYQKAVERAGGEAVLIPLKDEAARNRLIPTLDAFVLPGSSADINPREYQDENRGQSKKADKQREDADKAVLKLAIAEKKPVLAICYGFQMLNVHQRGSLVQDIPKKLPERPNAAPHGPTDTKAGAKGGGDQRHDAVLTAGSILAKLAGSSVAHINSYHHQAIDKLGENLRATALAPDGVVEAVEWIGDSNWIVGVQWHPERMPPEDDFSKRLFEELLVVARPHEAVAPKT